MSFPSNRGAREQEFRPLSDQERQLLAALLSAEFTGKSALAEQVKMASVRAIDDNGSLEFAPTDGTPAQVDRRIPVEAEIDDSDGVTIHVLLHVVDGIVKELEVYRDDSGRVQRALAPGELRLLVL
jgi:hypothetical protein